MTENTDAWVRTIEEFNRTGSFESAVAEMDGSFTMHSTAGEVSGRDAARAALENMRDQRQWTRCEVLGSIGSGDWVSVLYRHTFAGTTMTGASVVRFNRAGKATEMWSHTTEDEPEPS